MWELYRMHSGEALEKEQGELAAGQEVQVSRRLLNFDCSSMLPWAALYGNNMWCLAAMACPACLTPTQPPPLRAAPAHASHAAPPQAAHSPPRLPLFHPAVQVLNAQELVAVMAPSAVGNGNGTSRKSLVVNYGL